ncbi:hypothetical protein niasHS_015141 [Heterodera schachtii]|uniref:Uncharacterized protein n=1 Tax=Heterodera schachtii TaxID=97005 RepID=A0ABD2I580_HETSC
MLRFFGILFILSVLSARAVPRALNFGTNLEKTSPIFAVSSLKLNQKEPPIVNENNFLPYFALYNKNMNDENLWSSALSRQLLFRLNRL